MRYCLICDSPLPKWESVKNAAQKYCGLQSDPGSCAWKVQNIRDILRRIKRRCYDADHKDYKWYGGRGIKVSEEWLNNRILFIKWAINNNWEKGLEIDRRNNDGDYTPENCRFISHKEQCYNRRSNKILKFNGREMPLKKWELELNLPIRRRLLDGWPLSEAMTRPKKIYIS